VSQAQRLRFAALAGHSIITPGALAFDKNSVRRRDADGRLHVAKTNLTIAAVNPYLGAEIPDYERLGLDPEKRYRLLRDPDELRKAVPTFNNIPLLREHVPVSSTDYPANFVIGSTGTDAAWAPPYVTNSLVIWREEDIRLVEGGEKREISAGYRYTPDPTPGTWQGESYDIVMRDIEANHLSLVVAGRAGPTVLVADEHPDERGWRSIETALRRIA
jgi:hypothetical protein